MGLVMGLTMGLMGRLRQECGLQDIGKRRWAAQSCEVLAVGQLRMEFH
jgi:hypothetical protein